MVARSELGHDAAERRMDADLTCKGLGDEALAELVERDAGFVAARFDSEYQHMALQVAVSRANIRLLRAGLSRLFFPPNEPSANNRE